MTVQRRKSSNLIYLGLFLLSASIPCFEIGLYVHSLVMSANSHAFTILLLAILGIGTGGIFPIPDSKAGTIHQTLGTYARVLIVSGLSALIFPERRDGTRVVLRAVLSILMV